MLHDDALDYLKREARDWSEWKLVANLPYSVASPILVELALGGRASREPSIPNGRRTIPGPRPAADGRHAANRGGEAAAWPSRATPDYGVLTLLVQLDYEPQGWFKIPASCFFPEPDVDSACVCLVRREQPLLPPETARGAFIQDRETQLLAAAQDDAQTAEGRTGLSRAWSAEFERLKLSPQIRAEEVSLEQFAQIAQGSVRGRPI